MALSRVWEEELEEGAPAPRHLRVVAPAAPRVLRTGSTVHARRLARERMLHRRRRSALAVGLVVSLVILAWPGHAFGGVVGSTSAMENSTSLLSAGMVYVVQPGDSLSSIAKMMNPANPTVARQSLRRELGSSNVVVGEHVAIP